MAADFSPSGKPSIVRVRAGLLLLLALILFCVSAGRFVGVQMGLGWAWGMVGALIVAVLVGFGLSRLSRKIYFIISAVITLLTTYLAYDFLRGALEWSSTLSLLFALVPFAILAAAFWDFRRLKLEVSGWLNSP
ncbi:hypothetical protein [Aquabacter cavernae]|uniref:hypothetical protein n=1 Tax=Aquabacter cavernae TaxID=2496029 RepID=UPI000F8C7454|nr:hypothetical protein [Aquabacter cavernae]